MRVPFVSIPVADQARALQVYTEQLGFTLCADLPGGEYRWITLTPSEGPEGVEVVLEPLAFPPAQTYYRQLYEAGVPAAEFLTADVDTEADRLRSVGITVRGEPATHGPYRAVVFEDGCGNLIQLVQPLEGPQAEALSAANPP